MRAWRLDDSTPTPDLRLNDAPQPTPGPGELLVRVHAAGVTPTELSWYPTTHLKSGAARHGAVPGHEFSGVVAAVGAGAAGFAIGQEVFGMNDWYDNGATAEYCLTRPEFIALKPRRLVHAQAAAVPIGALTAWQGLFDRARLRPEERVLVHGGSGAVGVFVIQLARLHGARVITTASSRNEAFLRALGAERVIDYRTERFEESAEKIDVVFDTVGGATLHRSWSALAPGGRMVTIVSPGDDERTKSAFFIVTPDHAQLTKIAEALESGSLEVAIDTVVPFARAGEAYARRLAQGAGRGKVVVGVTE